MILKRYVCFCRYIPITSYVTSCLFLFLLVFPKGGITLANVPITWGYAILYLLGLVLSFSQIHQVDTKKVVALLCLLPLQIVSLGHLLVNPIKHVGFTLSYIISFFFLPFLFLLLLNSSIQRSIQRFFVSWFKLSVLFIAVYGCILFFYRLFTGTFIEIPFLTVNFHDLGMLDEKHIDRGFFTKLISTYNNGNIYGVCVLMFLPLYNYLEQSILKRSVVKFSLILTISRTVWVGLIISELLSLVFQKNRSKIGLLFVFISLSVSVCFILSYSNLNFLFLLDASLGGRAVQLQRVNESLGLFSTQPFWGITEISYASVLYVWGLLGLISFVLALLAPIMIYCLLGKKSEFNRSILIGLITYLVVSCSDAALLYIPVMCFYWFFSSFLLNQHTNEISTK